MKKIILFLFILFSVYSCTVDLNYCDCTRKVYEVTEYQGEVIDSRLIKYRQFNGNCDDDEGYYISNIFWNGSYKHYTLTETHCY